MVVDDTNVYDENGELKPIGDRVTLKTLTFDYSVPCFVAGEAEISEDDPLYFGYAYWAAANTEAQYFIMTTFNITDWENYVEKTNDATAPQSAFSTMRRRNTAILTAASTALQETAVWTLPSERLPLPMLRYCQTE